jgi:hypothetical protein
VEDIKAEIHALESHLIDSLPKSDATGVAGKLARATIVIKETPTLEDFSKFIKYVVRNNAFEMIQKRLSAAAVKERQAAGKKIPGVGKFTYKAVSLNKL